MPRKRKYSDEQLINAVQNSQSIRSVLQKIGLTPAGGNYESIKKRIHELGIDTSHFLGQAILKGKTHTYGTRPLEDILVHKKLENTWRLKKRLLVEHIKEHRCEKCRGTEWQGEPIPLELHHKDGDRTNNTLQNIELLCPNCHALTDNYRGGKKKV
ncbi:MAG: HNH endonuclease [Chloroflexi bacterium]|nr:HNH endonuclease [Chloroflexota bacterium]